MSLGNSGPLGSGIAFHHLDADMQALQSWLTAALAIRMSSHLIATPALLRKNEISNLVGSHAMTFAPSA